MIHLKRLLCGASLFGVLCIGGYLLYPVFEKYYSDQGFLIVVAAIFFPVFFYWLGTICIKNS